MNNIKVINNLYPNQVSPKGDKGLKDNLKVTSKNKMNIKNKKGISGVLTTIILIAMVIVLVGIIYSVIIPMVRNNIEHANACSPPNIIGKISLNRLNTCYDDSTKIIKVSMEIEDLEYDKILVYISQGGTSKTMEIIQAQNSGKTYEYNINDLGLSGKPETIKIAPVIEGEQCDIIDSINEVATCP